MQFFGEYLHAFADTFSHRDDYDKPVDAVWKAGSKELGIGHGPLEINPVHTRIIAMGRQAPSIVWPHNAAVFNENKALEHIIELPSYVKHSFDGTTTENFKPEGIVHLNYHMGRIALRISFEFQWIQTRICDPFTREWGEIIGIHRR